MSENNEKWAFITGASSGIGKSIALELSKRGYKIIIHGRNKNALTELMTILPKGTMSFEQELTTHDALENTKNFFKEKGITPTIIVNNAGFGVGGPYKDTNLDREISMIDIHVNYPISLIKWFLNTEGKNQKFILNTSSLYAYFPVPRQAVYGASKAFIHNYALALSSEIKGSNFSITSLCPGLTYSNFRIRQDKPEKKAFFGMTSEAVAKQGVDALLSKKAICVPGFFNKLMAYFMPRLPHKLVSSIMYRINKARGL